MYFILYSSKKRLWTGTQSKLSVRLSVRCPVVRRGSHPPPHPQIECCSPPPFGSKGGDTLACRVRGEGTVEGTNHRHSSSQSGTGTSGAGLGLLILVQKKTAIFLPKFRCFEELADLSSRIKASLKLERPTFKL